MSRHSQPRPSGGWIPLLLAVVTALGGASIASNVAAGPARVAIGWATLIGAALFLLQWRSERRTSLRLARVDHARRRDAVRLREELAEAHHRSRLAVERSYAAVARSEALAAEVNRLLTVLAQRPIPAPSVQLLPVMQPAAVQPTQAAPIVTPEQVPSLPVTPAAHAAPGTSFELPLVERPTPSAVPLSPVREAPFASPTPAADPAGDRGRAPRHRVDLRSVEAVPTSGSRYARGA